MSVPLVLQAPAKVNLILEVTGRLADGYHELDSWMHKVSLFDYLTLESGCRPGIHLSCSDPALPCDEHNLVYRAAALFYQHLGQAPHLVMTLEKNIPVAAGLGGGSSDCAATLQGLNRLHGEPLSQPQLRALGKELGADVPFFLYPAASARARGIGERLSPLAPLTECFLVLVNPGIAVSTRWVFANLRKKFTGSSALGCWDNSPKTANYALTTGGKKYILGRASEGCLDFKLVNDLEEVTIAKYPEISVIKKFLLAHESCGALMSGSGPTVFGLFLDEKHASSCLDAMKAAHPGWRGFLTTPLGDQAGPLWE
jgi:4-diphosphocytidyl-2-C-methyl-D-erythritol kinase